MHPRYILLLACSLVLLGGAAPDQGPPAGRYQLHPTASGAFVRLDTQTGAMSLCQLKDGAWACQAMRDDGSSLEAENERLKSEVEELKRAVKRLEELVGRPEAGDKDRSAGRSRPKFELPTPADVDRAFDYFESMLRRFKERLRDWEDSGRRSL